MGNRKLIRLSLREEARLLQVTGALLQNGLETVESFRAAEDVLPARGARAARRVRARLEEGADLAEAVTTVLSRTHPVHAAMLHVADRTGDPVSAMKLAGSELQSRLDLHGQTLAAALYPALVLTATIIAAVVLVTVVLPAAADILAPVGRTDGTGEGAVDRIARQGASFVGWVAGTAGAVAVSLAALGGLRGLPAFRRRLDAALLYLPLAGGITQATQLLLFARAMAAMSAAGAPLSEAFEGAAECVPNEHVRIQLLRAAGAVAAGVPASEAVLGVRGMGVMRRWFAVGEAGADVTSSMQTLADVLEQRLVARRRSVSSLLEPALTVGVGGVVIALVLTVVKPLFELYGSLLP